MPAVLVKSLLYTHRLSTNAKVRTARGKNNANIEEMIADGGFGFPAKVKLVSFLEPEKVNMLVFLRKKCKHGHRQPV